MLLSELLLSLENIAKENNIAIPYVVGGFVRDRVMGLTPDKVKDIDITTGNNQSSTLATLASAKWVETNFRMYDDGHTSLSFGNMRIDFSNNFKIPGIIGELNKIGIENPTDLQKELFSRDFTINTLLQPMDLNKEPLDLTGRGTDDIKNKIIRTPINPELTIGYDPRRILRAIKLAVKFNFTIEKELKDTIIKYRGGLQNLSLEHIKKQINEMLTINADKTIELLTEYKLLPIIPLSKMMQLEVIKRKKVQDIIDE